MAVQYYEGIGRRKESTARVRVMSGSGMFVVNQRTAESYFPRLGDLQSILAPLDIASENRTLLDISVVVRGGGVTGQTDSVRLGIARALLKMNPDLRSSLRKSVRNQVLKAPVKHLLIQSVRTQIRILVQCVSCFAVESIQHCFRKRILLKLILALSVGNNKLYRGINGVDL
jgi:small subunit ribosomal protein S9